MRVTDVGAETLGRVVVENCHRTLSTRPANVRPQRATGVAVLADAKRGCSYLDFETVDDTPWAGSDMEFDDEFVQDDDDEHHSEDDGYFVSMSANAARPSRWSMTS